MHYAAYIPGVPTTVSLMPIQHAVFISFIFALGACIGSFLNVVVWRLPRGESLIKPPSHCPKCNKHLLARDNIPIFGWIKLGGRCRFCREPISPRYPIVEALTALLFVAYYVLFYICHYGPLSPDQIADMWSGSSYGIMNVPEPAMLDWPVLLLYLLLISGLLAASLIDAELFIIPTSIPWLLAGVGIIAHAVFDHPEQAGAISLTVPMHIHRWGSSAIFEMVGSVTAALAAGGTVGLGISMLLWFLGLMPVSFPNGEPILESERKLRAKEIRDARREGREAPPIPPRYTPSRVRREMAREILFLLPPLACGVVWLILTSRLPGVGRTWESALRYDWVNGLLGALFGGMVGAAVVWTTRILGTFAFGRIAMGLGDADLMFGVGAILGAGPATIAFFIAPFFGLLIAVYMMIARRHRELPYGPYLSLATAFVMLFYFRIYAYVAPGVSGILIELSNTFSQAGLLSCCGIGLLAVAAPLLLLLRPEPGR